MPKKCHKKHYGACDLRGPDDCCGWDQVGCYFHSPLNPINAKAKPSNTNDVLCGDLNQGVGDNLEVVSVSGDTDGYGLPNSVMIKTKTTGCIKKYIPEG